MKSYYLLGLGRCRPSSGHIQMRQATAAQVHHLIIQVNDQAATTTKKTNLFKSTSAAAAAAAPCLSVYTTGSVPASSTRI
jgi:hypothetical protein